VVEFENDERRSVLSYGERLKYRQLNELIRRRKPPYRMEGGKSICNSKIANIPTSVYFAPIPAEGIPFGSGYRRTESKTRIGLSDGQKVSR